jgi:hypothetical protein
MFASLLCAAALAHARPDCPPVAQAPTQEQLSAGVKNARDHGFLWRISKDGRSSYLYGTVHVAKPDWMYPGPQVTRALNASDALALEIDSSDPDMQQRMSKGMNAPIGAALPEPLQKRLDDRARVECLPSNALSMLIPEMQVAALMTLAGRRDGLDPAYGIDMVLAGWGHSANKKVVSLETPELQLKTLQMDSSAETIEVVQSALDELESGRARPTLKRVAQVWADSDLSALTHYEKWCDCMKTAADRADMKRMLDERNPALADGIDALHAQGLQVFAAVGSLHMIGPMGLPALMERRGYRVERVNLRR